MNFELDKIFHRDFAAKAMNSCRTFSTITRRLLRRVLRLPSVAASAKSAPSPAAVCRTEGCGVPQQPDFGVLPCLRLREFDRASSLRVSEGFARAEGSNGERLVSMPLYEHVFLARQGRDGPAGRSHGRSVPQRHRRRWRLCRQGRVLGRQILAYRIKKNRKPIIRFSTSMLRLPP